MWSTIDYSRHETSILDQTAMMRNSVNLGTAYLTRSNSTASSTISLRLLKEICSAGGGGLRAISSNDDYCGARGGSAEEQDEDFVGSENMDESGPLSKSRHQSQNSQTSQQTNMTSNNCNVEVRYHINSNKKHKKEFFLAFL